MNVSKPLMLSFQVRICERFSSYELSVCADVVVQANCQIGLFLGALLCFFLSKKVQTKEKTRLLLKNEKKSSFLCASCQSFYLLCT